MHQVIGAGRANLREAWRVLTTRVCQHVLSVFKAENLVLLCRNESAHDGRRLCRNRVSCFVSKRCDASASKERSISSDDACLDEFPCLGNRGDGRSIAAFVALSPGDQAMFGQNDELRLWMSAYCQRYLARQTKAGKGECIGVQPGTRPSIPGPFASRIPPISARRGTQTLRITGPGPIEIANEKSLSRPKDERGFRISKGWRA